MPTEQLDRRTFWFLRHGETDWNAQSLAQGQVEVALNANGMAQAHAAAAKLQRRGLTEILVSPLLRARVTAQVAGEALGLPVTVESELIEAAFGDHEGERMSAWFDEWVAGRFTPPGGESFAELRARAVRALNRCLARPGPVLVVAHGALMRATRAAMGLDPNFRTPNATPVLCEPPAPGAACWTLKGAE